MNLIEALKQADGKPVARKEWGESGCTVSLGEEKIVWGNRAAYGMYCNDLLADDWYVVQPQSKIEEAIERECQTFCWDYSGNSKKLINRIVNLALDEAANVVGCPSSSGLEGKYRDEILALRLKE